jgi:hypothetical protein
MVVPLVHAAVPHIVLPMFTEGEQLVPPKLRPAIVTSVVPETPEFGGVGSVKTGASYV